MIEFIKHATGACGEHWHPSLLTVLTGFLGITTSIYYLKYRILEKIRYLRDSRSSTATKSSTEK
jgi:hypothetical protein